jgi:hypothetical protein
MRELDYIPAALLKGAIPKTVTDTAVSDWVYSKICLLNEI